MSIENNKLQIELKQSQERIEDLEKEELKHNEMIKDLNTIKVKNEQDFIEEVTEIKLQNVELICKLEEITKERDVLQKDNAFVEDKKKLLNELIDTKAEKEKIDTYKNEVKRLEEELNEVKKKNTDYGNQIFFLK